MTSPQAATGVRHGRLWASLMRIVRPLRRLVPASVWSHLWFNGPFSTPVGKGCLRLYHGGGLIENEVFWTGTFWSERGTIGFFSDLVRQADLMVDIGANTGIFALMSKAMRLDLPVIAVEPSDANYAMLTRNIALNGYDICALNVAVTAVDGPITFYDLPGLSYSASLESDWRDGTVAREVQGMTLDSIVDSAAGAARRILLKIDVEGHEPQVLEGAIQLLHGTDQPAFVIEIIRDYVFDRIVEQLPPGRYRYLLVHEDTQSLTDMTDALESQPRTRFGNYLILSESWTVPALSPRIVAR